MTRNRMEFIDEAAIASLPVFLQIANNHPGLKGKSNNDLYDWASNESLVAAIELWKLRETIRHQLEREHAENMNK